MSRRALLVARADLRRAVRDRTLVGLFALIAVVTLPTYANGLGDVYTFEEAILLTPFDFMKYAVLPAVAAGYAAVAGDREAGRLRYLLGLGATRRDLLVGAVLSRGVVVAVPLAALLVVLGGPFAAAYGVAVLPTYAAVATVVLLYGLAWTGVTVGLSAATGSRYRALAAAFLAFVTFSPTLGLWRVLIRPLVALVVTGSASTAPYAALYEDGVAAPAWIAYTERLNPLFGFYAAGEWLAADLAGVGTGPAAGPTAFGVAVVAAFGAAPVVVGARRLDRADLAGDAGPGPLARLRARLPDPGPDLGRGLTTATRVAVGRRLAAGLDRLPDGPAATVCRRDLRATLSNRLVWGVAVVLLVVLVPRLWATVDPGDVSGPLLDVSRLFGRGFALLAPVVAVAAGYRAVAGEREAGTVRLLLAGTATRRDLMVGKLAARLVAVTVVLVPFLALAVAFAGVRLGPGYVAAALAGAGWTLAYALAWTGVTVGLSAATARRYRAVVGAVTVLLVCSGVADLWRTVVLPAAALVVTGRAEPPRVGNAWGDAAPEWALYVLRTNPLAAYGATDEWFRGLLGYATDTGDPLLGAFGVAVLVAFGVLPVAIGLWRFERVDLG